MIPYDSAALKLCSKCGFKQGGFRQGEFIQDGDDVFTVKYKEPSTMYITGSSYPQHVSEHLECTCMRCGFNFLMEIYK